jgi:hypothetical protein
VEIFLEESGGDVLHSRERGELVVMSFIPPMELGFGATQQRPGPDPGPWRRHWSVRRQLSAVAVALVAVLTAFGLLLR